MKFVINEVEYEAESIERISARQALALVKQAKVGVQSLARQLEQLGRLGYDDDGNVAVLPKGDPRIDDAASLDSAVHLNALLAFIWLARQLAGERLTFEESCDFEILSLRTVADEDDEDEDEAEPDPTPAPTASPLAEGASPEQS